MEIRKADSKGRVTGFEPGELYVFHRHLGHFYKFEAPERDLGTAEEAEYLLNLAMRNKALGSYEVVE